MQDDDSFRIAYRQLEERMRTLAEKDGDVFLPNSKPEAPVDYVLICMEPSLGRWARSKDEAQSKVAAGFRNFLFSFEDFILQFCARRYLCGTGGRYHITDLAKGAMLVKLAALVRRERYDRWYALLLEEIDLIATPRAGIVAVGNSVSRHLQQKTFPRPFARVIHYSGQAARARNQAIVGRECEFEAFKDSVSLGDLIATAKDVLAVSGVPSEFRDAALARLAKSELSTSRKKLIFHYKIAFESM